MVQEKQKTPPTLEQLKAVQVKETKERYARIYIDQFVKIPRSLKSRLLSSTNLTRPRP